MEQSQRQSTISYNQDKQSAATQYTSILDIDLNQSIGQSYAEILDSPRTKEAMKNLGIIAGELNNVSYETVRNQLQAREKKKNVPAVLVDLRYDNMQQKRQTKRQLIIEVSWTFGLLFN